MQMFHSALAMRDRVSCMGSLSRSQELIPQAVWALAPVFVGTVASASTAGSAERHVATCLALGQLVLIKLNSADAMSRAG